MHVKSRLTDNAAADNAYNVIDMASLLQAVRNAGANNVVILGARRTRAQVTGRALRRQTDRVWYDPRKRTELVTKLHPHTKTSALC
jgi:hypothetical protein